MRSYTPVGYSSRSRLISESVVDTKQDSCLGRFGANRVDNATGASHAARGRAEVHVITFQKRRQMRREHPFTAHSNRPTRSGLGGLAILNAGVSNVCACMAPCSTALEVEQPGGLYCIANARRQSIEPLIIEVSHCLRAGQRGSK